MSCLYAHLQSDTRTAFLNAHRQAFLSSTILGIVTYGVYLTIGMEACKKGEN
jgi:hypothetical protein